MLWEKKNDYKRKPQNKQDPFKKSEALEVLIVERNVLMFLSELNKDQEEETFITQVWLFDFWKYIQKKRDSLDSKLFEKD
jgi:hypothetical protein